jgi:hypothetical protein
MSARRSRSDDENAIWIDLFQTGKSGASMRRSQPTKKAAVEAAFLFEGIQWLSAIRPW